MERLYKTKFSLYAPLETEGILVFFWDLETTDLHINYAAIIQIRCVCRRFYVGKWETVEKEIQKQKLYALCDPTEIKLCL